MDVKSVLIDRLDAGNPGWREWKRLISYVKSLEFDYVKNKYMGNFYVSGKRLSFSELGKRKWPSWLPAYVSALYGMKADEWEMAGGYAGAFRNKNARVGSVFSPFANDEALGFPLIDVPDGIFPFQTNAHGAMFFVNKNGDVLYPHAEAKKFEKLDTLEAFTRKNIKQALERDRWFAAYSGLKATLID